MLVKCKYCGEKSQKSEMLCVEKGATKYYIHESCDIAKQQERNIKEIEKMNKKKDVEDNKKYRDEAISIFYDYTKSLEPIMMLNVAFKKCIEKGLTMEDVRDTMLYIVKNKCVLRFPMGILYYIDRAMKEKKEVEKINKQNERNITAPIKIMPLSMKKEDKANDDYDISDLL